MPRPAMSMSRPELIGERVARRGTSVRAQEAEEDKEEEALLGGGDTDAGIELGEARGTNAARQHGRREGSEKPLPPGKRRARDATRCRGAPQAVYDWHTQ